MTIPPATLNVTISTDDSSQAQKLAFDRLTETYPGYSFNIVSSSIINNQWVGIFSTSAQPKISTDTEDDENKTASSPPVAHVIVLFTIKNGQLDSPEKPFEHKSPYVIPLRADSEDKNEISPILEKIKNGDSFSISGKLSFKYRTNAFAFWNIDKKNIVINNSGNIFQCDIDDNNTNVVLTKDDIGECINSN